MNVRIAPSILSADFARLGEQVQIVEAAGAGLIHVDVMDGHFVPNLTMGPLVVAALKRITTLPLDVHLMISEPDRYLDAFAQAGASTITVHVEAAPHLHRTLTRIRELGARAGAGINPGTPAGVLRDVLDSLDQVIVMSVNPGFGGQSFIARSVDKVREVTALTAPLLQGVDIEVDGGVDLSNAGALVEAGATILVAGASVFGQPDPAAATVALLRAAKAGRLLGS
jgi:ribulose-phosphate 3-epimerase